MNSDLVAVLDLGSTKVTCLAASSEGKDGMTIHAIATAPCRGMKKGQVYDPGEVARAISKVVSAVESQVEEEIDGLVVGVTGTHIEGVNSQGLKPIYPAGRKITHQDVLEVINHSREISLGDDREQIQALPREFRVDGERNVQKPIGRSGKRLEVFAYIVSGQSSSLQMIEQVVQDAGKQVEQMVIQSLAAGIGVLKPLAMEEGAAVVDIGGSTTDIAIFINGSIAFSASVPLGGLSVTNDLGTLLKTSPDEAEKLKIQSGSAIARMVDEKESIEVMQLGQPIGRPMSRRVLCEIIESRMREIATLVGKELDRSPFGTALPGGVTLTGGGAALPGTVDLFNEVLPKFRFQGAEPNVGKKFTVGPGMATSVGLASFTIQCFDEFSPAEGTLPWRDRVKSLFSLLNK